MYFRELYNPTSRRKRLYRQLYQIYNGEPHDKYLLVAVFLMILFLASERLKKQTVYKSNNENLSQLPSIIHDPAIFGGIVYRVPVGWNRFHSPWIKRSTVPILTPKQSRHRYLYSSTRIGTSDGLGHSMGVVNFELNLALQLNLTYTHRIGQYSSLTRHNRMAVEQFFGWGVNEIPRLVIQQQGCYPKNSKWPDDDDIYSCHVCHSPMFNGSLKIKQLVHLPMDLGTSSCNPDRRECKRKLEQFMASHPESHTIFQISQSICSSPLTHGKMLDTKDIFYNKYWKQHGRLPWKQLVSDYVSHRPIRLRLNELSIAVHVRRGDFLDRLRHGNRRVTHDEIFAFVVSEVLSCVTKVGGRFANMPIAVHIYSEGNLVRKNVLSTHSIDSQDRTYYDGHGNPRNESWWRAMILKPLRQKNNIFQMSDSESLRVVLHISEDTLLSLHEMISADIFIGSISGMSSNLVWSIARGLVLIPNTGSIDNERGKKGLICCSLPFDNNNGNFSQTLFKKYWRVYSQANEYSFIP